LYNKLYTYAVVQSPASEYQSVGSIERLDLYEEKQRQRWFDVQGTEFLDERKRTKFQWVLDPWQSNVDNLNNVRRKATIHFRNNRR
jgi:hypothetical protein